MLNCLIYLTISIDKYEECGISGDDPMFSYDADEEYVLDSIKKNNKKYCIKIAWQAEITSARTRFNHHHELYLGGNKKAKKLSSVFFVHHIVDFVLMSWWNHASNVSLYYSMLPKTRQ